ncbi:DUF5343 domain-containing protein [Roseococcus microcysteis]|uniref:DUF5343 domain-containing protein n=1 Tax=Roseococcus microcysteis TaxID=2771361 RepID=UPI001E30C082|nr:DUF5343 domain-containing protein [Roseococcus microcysteis]
MQEARRPERFTTDFLETKLGQSGGSARAIIPLLKRMGFLNSDGSPTKLYDQFRNEETRKAAVAEGARTAYKDLFDRNDFAYSLSREKLTSLITEMTGLEKDSTVIKCTVATFWQLKELADFEVNLAGASPGVDTEPLNIVPRHAPDTHQPTSAASSDRQSQNVRLSVGYTINLNLPETTNPDVFNAIFKALREHLLQEK